VCSPGYRGSSHVDQDSPVAIRLNKMLASGSRSIFGHLRQAHP
jgi:hypothetical protein